MDGDGWPHEVSEGYRDYLEWEQAICTVFWQKQQQQKKNQPWLYSADILRICVRPHFKNNVLIIYLEEEISRQNSVMGKFAHLDSFWSQPPAVLVLILWRAKNSHQDLGWTGSQNLLLAREGESISSSVRADGAGQYQQAGFQNLDSKSWSASSPPLSHHGGLFPGIQKNFLEDVLNHKSLLLQPASLEEEKFTRGKDCGALLRALQEPAGTSWDWLPSTPQQGRSFLLSGLVWLSYSPSQVLLYLEFLTSLFFYLITISRLCS